MELASREQHRVVPVWLTKRGELGTEVPFGLRRLHALEAAAVGGPSGAAERLVETLGLSFLFGVMLGDVGSGLLVASGEALPVIGMGSAGTFDVAPGSDGLEALVEGEETRAMSEVPLPEHPGGVAGVREQVGQR